MFYYKDYGNPWKNKHRLCSFPAHVALWLEVNILFLEKLYKSKAKEPMTNGTQDGFWNRTPYWNSHSVSRDCVMRVSRANGPIRCFQRTQACPWWCGSVMMACLLSCQQEDILTAFFPSVLPTRKKSRSKWDRIFFQLHSMHILFQPPPMRNMILSDLVVLRQSQPMKYLGVHW